MEFEKSAGAGLHGASLRRIWLGRCIWVSRLASPSAGSASARTAALGFKSSHRIIKKDPQMRILFYWRRRRDLNPRDTHAPYSLSRGAPSASWVLLHRSNYLFDKAKMLVCQQWRRGWDSNPCGVAPKRFSRPPRYDHFDTSPGGENRAVARELYYHDSRGVSTAF